MNREARLQKLQAHKEILLDTESQLNDIEIAISAWRARGIEPSSMDKKFVATLRVRITELKAMIRFEESALEQYFGVDAGSRPPEVSPNLKNI